MFLEELTDQIIGAAIEVHRTLGPGLLEATYEACLFHELTLRGLSVARQKALPVVYKGVQVDCGYRVDLLVDARVIVEIKAIARLEPVHTAQLLSYLRLFGVNVGLLINFNVTQLKIGLRRLVNKAPNSPPRPPR
jgi:GxxExxY protein